MRICSTLHFPWLAATLVACGGGSPPAGFGGELRADSGTAAASSSTASDPARDTPNDAGGAAAPPDPSSAARYAVLGVVYGPDDATSYLSLLDTLEPQDIDYSRALEVPGAASVTAYGSWLFVGDSANLTITRYATASGTFVKDGVLNLSNRDIDDLEVDDFGNTFIDAHKAYLVPSASSTLIWDPTDLVVTGEIETPELVRDAPFDIDFGPGVLRDGRVYRAVTWRDFDNDITSPEQYLTVLDPETDTFIDRVPESRCPGLTNRVSADEQGNLYFSSWFSTVAQSLVLGTPKPCALRLNAGADEFDPDWQLTFSDLAEGREGAGLHYLSQSNAFMSIFHDERVSIDTSTTVADLDDSTNWRFWHTQLPAGPAEQLAGLDWLSSRTFTASAAGRTFVILPTSDFASTGVYEVTSAGAEHRFDVQGFSYQLLQLTRP